MTISFSSNYLLANDNNERIIERINNLITTYGKKLILLQMVEEDSDKFTININNKLKESPHTLIGISERYIDAHSIYYDMIRYKITIDELEKRSTIEANRIMLEKEKRIELERAALEKKRLEDGEKAAAEKIRLELEKTALEKKRTEEEKVLLNAKADSPVAIGVWKDNFINGTITMYKDENGLFFKEIFYNSDNSFNSELTKRLVEKNILSEKRLIWSESPEGEYFIIEGNGNLGVYDDMGLIHTALVQKPLEEKKETLEKKPLQRDAEDSTNVSYSNSYYIYELNKISKEEEKPIGIWRSENKEYGLVSCPGILVFKMGTDLYLSYDQGNSWDKCKYSYEAITSYNNKIYALSKEENNNFSLYILNEKTCEPLLVKSFNFSVKKSGYRFDDMLINRDIIYLFSHRRDEFLSTSWLLSKDNGASWNEYELLGNEDLCVSKENPLILYALLDDNHRIYKSDNGGKSWKKIIHTDKKGLYLRTIEISPNNENVIFVGTNDGLFSYHSKGFFSCLHPFNKIYGGDMGIDYILEADTSTVFLNTIEPTTAHFNIVKYDFIRNIDEIFYNGSSSYYDLILYDKKNEDALYLLNVSRKEKMVYSNCYDLGYR